MSLSDSPSVHRNDSPDPSSHATNIYDTEDAEGEWVDEADDDDMDFEPTTDDSEDVEFFDPAEDVEAEFHDVNESFSGVEFEISVGSEDTAEQDENDTETEGTSDQPGPARSVPVGRMQATHTQIMRLFGHAGLRDLFTTHRPDAAGGSLPGEDDEGEEGFGGISTWRRRRRIRRPSKAYPTVPSEEGKRLMASGAFGHCEYYEDKLRRRKERLTRRFSGDGREVVAGTSDHSVFVYDIEAKRSILRIPGHSDDVNAVCFGDNSSPHILYSGSDDTLIKVWDRRSMGDSREAGVFMGHTEGLTYVDSKGDGRYVLSNGKDQTMKLWDLRKMMPTEKASELDPARFSTGFDYRFMAFSEAEYEPHPYDCSLVTFRGHRVLKTLIRCHFSPPGSTDSRYVYSGSEDGSVYIYNMDATLAGKIDVNKATFHSRPQDPDLYTHQYEMRGSRNPDQWKTCVRDASWHPTAPVVAATSWNGWGMATGTCSVHSWNDKVEDDEGEPKMGLRVDEHLEEDQSLYDQPQAGGRTSRFRSRLRSQRVRQPSESDGAGW
ncbi:MAG: hypothetical protein Q9220_006835 [cf. Caloplaca sp. 1 TL-2023]